MIRQISLVDYIAHEMQCTYVSDLKYLSRSARHTLARKLSQLSASQADLQDWRDACAYLTDVCTQGKTAEEIRQAMIARLLG